MSKLSRIFVSIFLVGLSATAFAQPSQSMQQQQQFLQAYVQNLFQKQQTILQAEVSGGNGQRPTTVAPPSAANPNPNNPAVAGGQTARPSVPSANLPPSNPWLRPNPWSNTTFNPWSPTQPNTSVSNNRAAAPGTNQLPAVPNIYSPSGTSRTLPTNIYK
jgi:hypothetical protein